MEPSDGALIHMANMTLLPPPPNVCQVCAVDHRPHEPHNAQSLYYGVWFQMKHGRDPTWGDAMAHCSAEVQEQWTQALNERGVTW